MSNSISSIKYRGTTFRQKYVEVKRLRCVLGKAPVLLLTATATETIKEQIKSNLGLVEVADVVAVPDRYSMMYEQ